MSKTKTFTALNIPRAPVLFTHERLKDRTPAERTPWPRLAGIKDGDISCIDFGDPAFAFRTGEGETARIYIAGSSMLRDVAAQLHLPLSKIGVTTLPDLQIRRDDLNRDQYGGWCRREGRLVKSMNVYWELQRLAPIYPQHQRSPVIVNTRDIEVRLPAGYRAAAFERDVHKALRRASLNSFALSELGKKHCRHLNVEPTDILRYTRYKFGAGERISLASEIYICRPREDVGRLTMIAERLVRAFVLDKAKA